MPDENSLLRQSVISHGDTKYSGVNINVNGGNVCLLIGKDLDESKVWELINQVKEKKKKGKFNKIKQWFRKKFPKPEEVTVPIQASDNDSTTPLSTYNYLPDEETGCDELSEKNKKPAVVEATDSVNRKPVLEQTFDNSNSIALVEEICDSDTRVATDDDNIFGISYCQSEKNIPSDQGQFNGLPSANLHKGSFSMDNDSDGDCNESNDENDLESTDVKQYSPLQEDLQLSCDYENSSHLTLDRLKPAEECTSSKQDKEVSVESQDSVHTVCEKSFSSGYPDITMSNLSIGSRHLLSNDILSNQICESNLELEHDKTSKNDHFNDVCMSVGSKASENVHHPDAKPLSSTISGEREYEPNQNESSSSNMETPSYSDLICDQTSELVKEERCQNTDNSEIMCVDISKKHAADKEKNLINSSLGPCNKICGEVNETFVSLNADEDKACSDSCSSQDTNTDHKYAAKLVKSSDCHGNVDNDILGSYKDIINGMSFLAWEHLELRIYAIIFHTYFPRKTNIVNLYQCFGNVHLDILVTQTSVGKKLFDKTRCSIPDSTKPECDVANNRIYFLENEKQQCGIRNRNLFLESHYMKPDFVFLEERFLNLSVVEFGLKAHASCRLYSHAIIQVSYNANTCLELLGTNGTDGTDEHLIGTLPEKTTEPNSVDETVITESREILNSTNSDLDHLGERKFNDKIVVTAGTKELPFEKRSEKFSFSTLPVSDVDETPREKKTHKHKKRLPQKRNKSDFPHGETSSLDCSFDPISDFPNDDSPPSSISYYSIHRAYRPRRRKGSHKPNISPRKESSDIKQFTSNLQDSGLGSSVEFQSWCMNDVESEVIKRPKMKKRTKYFDSLRHVRKSYSFKALFEQFFRNVRREKVKSIVRELHIDHRYLPLTDDFGLGSYFDRLNNGPPPSQQEQMRYEWLRLASFQHYTGAGNALNLARNGFYHRHTDGPTSTRCVYCDETCGSWQYFDDVAAVHRRLSPNCPSHTDHVEESMNVSINCDGPASTVNQNSASGSSRSENIAVTTTSTTSSTSTLKPTMALTSDVDDVTRELEVTHVSQAKPNNTNVESVPQQPTDDPEGTQRSIDQQRRTGDNVSGLPRTSSNAALPPVSTESRNNSRAGAGNFVDPSPIGKHTPQPPAPVNQDTSPLDNVKHPEYRTMAQRVNSFEGFPEYLDQTAEQMALAGFYFVGVADFTRCFCCGGGLRNWEAGDDPLLEHTRWFPRCGYVLRLKGERYVAAVQRRHQEHMAEQRRQQIELANRRDANRNAPDPMTTDAASVMREMGYADQRIRDTILAVRRQIGTHLITTQQVLSWLLDQDDDTATAVSRARYQPNNDTNSIYTGINMTSDNEDSFTTAPQPSMNSNVSTTAAKTRETVQGSGSPSDSKNTTTTSTGNGNQQTNSKSTASGADTSQGASSQSGSKRGGKKKKGKGNTGSKPGQTTGAGTAGAATGGAGASGDPEAAKKLLAENEKLRDMQTCKICMERVVNTTLLPCGHLVCCDICAARLRDCPVCRKKIKGTVKTFMS